MRLLNVFRNHIVNYIFRQSLVIIRCYKIVLWRLLCRFFLLIWDVKHRHTFVFFVVLRVFSCHVLCLAQEWSHYPIRLQRMIIYLGMLALAVKLIASIPGMPCSNDGGTLNTLRTSVGFLSLSRQIRL
jgi:hypothetical protein